MQGTFELCTCLPVFCLSGNYGTFVFVVEGTKKFMTNVDMVELQLSHFYYLARVATTGMRALTQAWGIAWGGHPTML